MSTRPFFETAKDIRRGGFLDDCSEQLQKAVAAVDETGKAAKLVIELTIKPASKGQGAFIVADKVQAKLPQLPIGETIMFGTPENNLVANDPRQKEIAFKAVDTSTGELKTVNA